MRGCRVENCVLDGARCHGLRILGQTAFRDVSLRYADLQATVLGAAPGPEYERVDFTGADLSENAITASFTDCAVFIAGACRHRAIALSGPHAPRVPHASCIARFM
jgi:uncharacterized protein YjbI with pentapeptide repeats